MKKLLMLISNGFEELEALSVADLGRRAGVLVDICSITGSRTLTGSHRIEISADRVLSDCDTPEALVCAYDGLVLPGGQPNANTLRDDPRVISIVGAFHRQKKLIGAICAAPIVLERAGLLKNRKATSYPNCLNETACRYLKEPVVTDGNLVTSRGAGTAIAFALGLISALGLSAEAESVKNSILY